MAEQQCLAVKYLRDIFDSNCIKKSDGRFHCHLLGGDGRRVHPEQGQLPQTSLEHTDFIVVVYE